MFASCGTRKVNETMDKSIETSYSKDEGSGSREIKSNTSINSSISQNNDKVNESQSKKITELFNENGSLKSRITELLDMKSIDKSKTVINTVTNNTIRFIETWRFLTINKNTREIIYRTKTVDRDSSWTANIGGTWGVLGIAFMITTAVFLYKYLKK